MKVLPWIFITSILLTITSCTNQENIDKQYTFFDIAGYFKKEAQRLQRDKPAVEKMVKKNQESEKKTIIIPNWENELELFITSDINKPAWKNSYKIQQLTGETQYTSTDPRLQTQKIIIKRAKTGKISEISIFNNTTNALYSSTEHLTYYPDSIYQIIKNQHVKILGENDYTITGKIISH